jgi:TolB-like protein/Tfp pilus assembly protein PilF
MSIFSELNRRSVLRVAAAYLVVGWLLTEVLTTILPTLGAPDWAAKAVILCFAFGFVPAVVLSWIYDLTPDGIKKDADTNPGDESKAVSVGKLDYLAIVGVILAVVFAAILTAKQSPDTSIPNVASVSAESVAVLPFVNMSNDEDNDYFSDGLTETLLHMLAQIPDLKVAARTSSFAFKDKNMDIREIAEALQVAHVLEGSVQMIGSRIRITAQLIRASDGYHVWSEIFDRESEDIFGIQDEIATKVGLELSASLLGTGVNTLVADAGTDDPDAYDLYLLALSQRATFSYGSLEAAEELLKGALLIDPDFLDAKTELASNYLEQLNTGLMNRDDALSSVLAITEQVMLEAPDDVVARAIHVFAQSAHDATEADSVSVVDAIAELEALVALNPREYQVRLLLTNMLQMTQRSEEALALQQESLENDPYNARIHFEIGSIYLNLDQLEEARAALQASLDIEPQQPNAYLRLATIALKSGDGVDYMQQTLKAMEVDSRDHEIPGFIAQFLYQLGLVEEADDFRKRVMAIAPTSAVAYRIELLRAISTNDADAGIVAARRAIENGADDRQFAFGGAVQYLLRAAASSDTVDAESAYLEQHWPGILDVDAPAIPARYLTAQRVAFDAWYQSLPREELLRRIDKIQEIAASYGFDPMQNSGARVAFLALTGEVEDATELALSDVFVLPVLMDRNWRTRFSQAQYSEMVTDPRVQAAMQKWTSEETAVRDKVRAYLLDLSAAS